MIRSDVFLLLAIVVIQTAILLSLPSLSRADIFFAVTVPEQFRESALARRIAWRYRAGVAFVSLATFAMLIRLPPSPWRGIAILGQIAGVAAAWALAHRAVKPHAAARQVTRVAAIAPRSQEVPGGLVVLSGPFVILGAAALFLYINWDAIPDRFARHWSGDGTPNGWSRKSLGSVYGPLLFGVIATAVATFTTSSLLKRTRQIAADGMAASSEWRFKRVNVIGSLVGCYLMAIVFSSFAIRPVLASDGRLGWETWLLFGAIALFTIGMTIWMVIVGQGGQRHVPRTDRDATRGDATPDDAWILGIIYFNPSDPALFVEKRMGLGWTLNFGNKISWFVLALVISPVFWLPRLLR